MGNTCGVLFWGDYVMMEAVWGRAGGEIPVGCVFGGTLCKGGYLWDSGCGMCLRGGLC